VARKWQGDLAPPTNAFEKVVARAMIWGEELIARHAVHGDPHVYDRARFPWTRELEAGWRRIRAELDRVLERRDALPAFHEITSDVATITTDQRWKTYVFWGYGERCPETCAECPETARLLERIPAMTTAFFSILDPGKHIPPHRGPFNGVLRYHLALKVPREAEKCRIRIGDRIRHWNEGESLVFDDSFEHEVWNDTDEHRAVLFVDFKRPTRFPARAVNEAMLALAPLTPQVREARRNTRAWVERYREGGRRKAEG